MGLKEILKRINKIESGLGSDEMVTLIVLENGKECRRTMPLVEATMKVLQQDTAYMFGTGEPEENRIIGIEAGDDDGFIEAVLGCEADPEEAKKFIETEPIEHGILKKGGMMKEKTEC